MNAFKRNLFIGYGISLLLLMISALASYISINNLLNSAELVNHTNEVQKKVEKVLASLVDAETGQRGFLITGNTQFLDPFNGSVERTTLLLNEVKSLTTENILQQRDCELLKAQALTRLHFLGELVQKKKDNEIIPDSLLLVGKKYMDSVRIIVKRIQNREEVYWLPLFHLCGC
jgi:CHASE3 domain sensor protein